MFKRVFKAFHYPEFRMLWFGACTSSIGTWMQKLAQSWLVYQLSDSKFMLGLDAFLGEIPIFLFSLIGGVIGIGVGVGGSWVLATVAGWATIVDMTAVVAALIAFGGVALDICNWNDRGVTIRGTWTGQFWCWAK